MLLATIESRPTRAWCTERVKSAGDGASRVTAACINARVRENSPCREHKMNRAPRAASARSCAARKAFWPIDVIRRRSSGGRTAALRSAPIGPTRDDASAAHATQPSRASIASESAIQSTTRKRP